MNAVVHAVSILRPRIPLLKNPMNLPNPYTEIICNHKFVFSTQNNQGLFLEPASSAQKICFVERVQWKFLLVGEADFGSEMSELIDTSLVISNIINLLGEIRIKVDFRSSSKGVEDISFLL